MNLTELKQRVLENLTAVAVGDSPTAEDADIVSSRYTALHDLLITEGLVNWLPTEDIPLWAETSITAMVVAECLSAFAVPEPRRTGLNLDGKFGLPATMGGPSVAERNLRRQVSKSYVPHSSSSEYF